MNEFEEGMIESVLAVLERELWCKNNHENYDDRRAFVAIEYAVDCLAKALNGENK